MEDISIAMSKYGRPITMNIRHRCLIQAVSGSGKSVLLANIVEKMCMSLRSNLILYVCDGKRGASVEFLTTRADRFAFEPADIFTTIQDFNTILDQRFIQMREMGKTQLTDEDLPQFPLIYLVIDEFNSISTDASSYTKKQLQEMQNLFTQIMSRCRVSNASVLGAGHQYQTDVLNSLARGQADYKFIMRSASMTDVSLLLADNAELAPATQITQKGAFFACCQNDPPVLAKSGYTPEDKLKDIFSNYAIDKRPEQDLGVVEKQ